MFLESLLRSVAGLQTECLSTWTIVVDNDAQGSAEAVVRPFFDRIPGLVYEIEPERGISAVRNRLVAIAGRLGADYVAFVDDDEWVERTWLVDLVRTAVEYDVQAVGGPVLPEYDDEIPEWIQNGRFFNRKRYETGTSLRLLSTSNLLLRREWLERLDGPFDRQFDLTGGGDSHMLARLHRLGARMVWCDQAAVHERVPSSRGNVRWILERRLRIGMTSARRELDLDPTLACRSANTFKALSRISSGLFPLPLALVRGPAPSLRRLCRCALGLGRLLGVMGYSYDAYRQVHGR
jgi:succinoglycan biosynthesis protein ExoM